MKNKLARTKDRSAHVPYQPKSFSLFYGFVLFSLVTSHWPLATAWANQMPSLLRGVIVADSQLGVRVVSVNKISQAYLADIRPEDIIVRIHDREVTSIDEFAALSQALRGRATEITVLVFRRGVPREIRLHLFSYSLLQMWGIEFVPDHDIRFAESQVGVEYWRRLGRGFEIVDNTKDALKSYLNALHNLPTHSETALRVAELYARISRQHFEEATFAEGIASLRNATLIMGQLFNHPLTDKQLQIIKYELQETINTLRSVTR